MTKINAVQTWENILLTTPRTIGVVWNTANNIFNTLTNPFTRGLNYMNEWYRKSIERVTSRTLDMKEYNDILESDTFKERLKKRFGNTKTWRINKFRQLWNIWYKAWWWVKSVLWTVPLVWNMTVTNAGDTLKDAWTTLGGALYDVWKAVVSPADNAKFTFTKVKRDRLAWLEPKENPTPLPKPEWADKSQNTPEKAEADSGKKKA